MSARIVLVLLGIVTGSAGAVLHRHVVDLGPITLPWGLLLALWTTAAMAWAAAALVRVGAAWFALGWTALVLAQQSIRPGSYLIAGDLVGWTFMAGGLLLLAGIVVLAPARRTEVRPQGGSGTPAGADRGPSTLGR